MLLGTVYVYSQDEMAQRGSIPEELLRPRREEAPRYPIDTVIGALGRGQAPQEAYEIARKTAAALLAGSMDASVLSSVSKVFLESCMTMLSPVNPRSFRLGSGREEPDGSVSFLVRFIGREQGVTGELFIRLEAPRPQPRSEPQPAEGDASALQQTQGEPEAETGPAAAEPESGDEAASAESEVENEGYSAEQAGQTAEPVPEPQRNVSAQKIWLFEDLILEEPRTREAENSESRHRFDFPPYERFF